MRKKLNGWRHMCVLFKIGLHFGHRLGGERKRDKRGERVYKAAGESVKNRQLHRQKQDAKSIHFLKVRRRGGEGGNKQTAREKTSGVCRGY